LGLITLELSLTRSLDALRGCVLQLCVSTAPLTQPARPPRSPFPHTPSVGSASSPGHPALALHPGEKPLVGAFELPHYPQTHSLHSREVHRELRSLQRAQRAEPRPPRTRIQEGKACSPVPVSRDELGSGGLWRGRWAGNRRLSSGGKELERKPLKRQPACTEQRREERGHRQALAFSDVVFQDRL